MIRRACTSAGDGCRRAVVTVVFASLGIATACSSVPSINEASPVAVRAESGEVPIGTASTAPDAFVRDESLPTLDDVLAQDRFVPLAVALERTSLDNVLADVDDFVLFAPTADAFASSATDIGIEYSTLMNDTRLLESILRYHIVTDPSTNRSWRTLNGSLLDVTGSATDSITSVDGVDVVDRVHVRNGAVLVMPRLVLPTSNSTEQSS